MVEIEYFVSPLSWLPELLVENEDSKFDALLKVEGALVLKAHQNILSGSVPFFKRSFRSGMKEMETGEVNFKDTETSADSLKALVRAVYGHKLVINAENVHDIHDTAKCLEMDEISVKCAEVMVNNLDVDTVFASWEYAHGNFAGADQLLKGCEEFITKHFQQVYPKTEFLKLDVGSIRQYLSSSQLSVSSENDVVDALFSWLDHDWENRFALIKQHSLLDLIFWDSVDASVQQVMSFKALRNRSSSCTDVAEKDALFMIYEKVTGLPVVAKKSLCRVTAEPQDSETKETGWVYVIQNASHSVFVYDPATEWFFDPKPLPIDTYGILGMISIDACAFIVLCIGRQLMLLGLQNGKVESKIDLILPPDVHYDGYIMAAVPANSVKVCIGLGKSGWGGGITGGIKLLLVYEMSEQYVEPRNSEGSLCSFRYSHCITDIRKTAVKDKCDMVVYTPGKLWFVQTKLISYDLDLESWSTPFGLDYGWNSNLVDSDLITSSALVAFDYIIIASCCDNECQIRMFNYRNGPSFDRISLKCSHSYAQQKESGWVSTVPPKVLLATMGQLLLVYLQVSDSCEAFSVKLESDGKPSRQLSRDKSMDQFKPDHMMQII